MGRKETEMARNSGVAKMSLGEAMTYRRPVVFRRAHDHRPQVVLLKGDEAQALELLHSMCLIELIYYAEKPLKIHKRRKP
jgi:hypothetical protein